MNIEDTNTVDHRYADEYSDWVKSALVEVKDQINNDPTRFKGTVKEFFDSSAKLLSNG